MPVIKIDDLEFEVPAGQNLIQAAAGIGIEIPHYCYHPGLSVSGNCRMCLVEVKGPRGTMAQIACNTFVAEGLEVYTQTPTVKKMRQGVMEFLLLNHPIDCPICDQAGECGLQDYYMQYGLYSNRSTVPKVEKAKVVDVGPLVVLDQERCIMCSRCVRFCGEVTKTHELVLTQRGEKTRIETFPGRELDNPYSGNVVDICPVGALTSKDFRFKKRVWFLSSTPSVCMGCARGCNIEIDHEKTRSYRYRPRYNADVNQWWLCDEGRLSYKQLHANRLDSGLLKGQPTPLSEAVPAAARLIQETVQQHGREAIVAVASSTASLEDNFMLRHLLLQATESEAVYGPNFEHWGEADNLLRMADKTPNTEGLKLLGIDTGADAATAALKNPAVKLVISLDNDAEALRQAIGGTAKVIFLGSHASPLALAADIALPITMHAEHYASYVNGQGRLQKVSQAYFPTSEARPGWKLVAELFKPMLTAAPLYADVEDVWTVMRGKIAPLASLTFYEIPDAGIDVSGQAQQPKEAAGVEA